MAGRRIGLPKQHRFPLCYFETVRPSGASLISEDFKRPHSRNRAQNYARTRLLFDKVTIQQLSQKTSGLQARHKATNGWSVTFHAASESKRPSTSAECCKVTGLASENMVSRCASVNMVIIGNKLLAQFAAIKSALALSNRTL